MFLFVALRCLLCAPAVQPFRRSRPSHRALWVSLLTRLRAFHSVAASAPPAQLQAMSVNVGLVMQALRRLPFWHPPRVVQGWPDTARLMPVHCPVACLPHIKKLFQCGDLSGFAWQCPSPLLSVSVPSPSSHRKTFSMSSNVIIFRPSSFALL
jgi:hypothetical protein